MTEKQEHSSARDFHSCSSKLVCPGSLVSLLICTVALVRVEIINQRVHDVEELVENARQNQSPIKVSTDTTNVKRSERVEEEFDHKIIKEKRDETEGNGFVLLYTVTSVRWPDNRALLQLTYRLHTFSPTLS